MSDTVLISFVPVALLLLMLYWLGRRLAIYPLKPPIEVLRAELTGDGSFIDVRLRIGRRGRRFSPHKPHPWSFPARDGSDIYLVDELSNERIPIAVTPKIGRSRSYSAGRFPVTGYALFFNRGGLMKEGSFVTVIFGEYAKRHVRVTGG